MPREHFISWEEDIEGFIQHSRLLQISPINFSEIFVSEMILYLDK
jgi:hypothetical protein